MNTLSNKQLFKLAHVMTKQVIQAGDNYQTTFGACLKLIKADYAKNVTSIAAETHRAKVYSKGAAVKGIKVADIINAELVKMVLRRNEVKTAAVEISLFSKVKSFFKAA